METYHQLKYNTGIISRTHQHGFLDSSSVIGPTASLPSHSSTSLRGNTCPIPTCKFNLAMVSWSKDSRKPCSKCRTSCTIHRNVILESARARGFGGALPPPISAYCQFTTSKKSKDLKTYLNGTQQTTRRLRLSDRNQVLLAGLVIRQGRHGNIILGEI